VCVCVCVCKRNSLFPVCVCVCNIVSKKKIAMSAPNRKSAVTAAAAAVDEETVIVRRRRPALRGCQTFCFVKFEGPVSAETCVENLRQQAIKARMREMYDVRVHLSPLHFWTFCHARVVCPR
jgi:hypothetical protein